MTGLRALLGGDPVVAAVVNKQTVFAAANVLTSYTR